MNVEPEKENCRMLPRGKAVSYLPPLHERKEKRKKKSGSIIQVSVISLGTGSKIISQKT